VDRLRAVYHPICLNSFNFYAALPKFLFNDFVVAFHSLRNADASGLYRNGVRVKFFGNNGNYYFVAVFFVVHELP
jgi:hypothetical protein